jgi:hypothetical protein
LGLLIQKKPRSPKPLLKRIAVQKKLPSQTKLLPLLEQ